IVDRGFGKMTRIRRFLAVGAVLALAATFTTSQLWGEPDQLKGKKDAGKGARPAPPKVEPPPADDAPDRLTQDPVLTYHAKDGTKYFSMQVRAKFDAPPPRPRDWLIMVDTSASQGGGPLAKSIKIVEAVVAGLAKHEHAKDDRVWIWTVSTKAVDLSGGF